MKNNILITGGAGFIGSHLVRYFLKKYPDYNIYNLDDLKYSSNLQNLKGIENFSNYKFIKCDICDSGRLREIFKNYNITKVINLAAESHVDNSIENPFIFAQTNIIGTLNLLQISKDFWFDNYSDKLFYHISTDEVYGQLGKTNYFTENSPYMPRSPYAASKASSDHFVRSFAATYSLPIVISNCSNNFGPHQHNEKLIPLSIKNILLNKFIPVYGDGSNIRDWLYVMDHVKAIDMIFHNGSLNESYNIGGNNELRNIDLIKNIICITDELLDRKVGFSKRLIKFVKDRAGHDFRYAVDSKKIRKELGWTPSFDFQDSLRSTIKWYIDNNINYIK